MISSLPCAERRRGPAARTLLVLVWLTGAVAPSLPADAANPQAATFLRLLKSGRVPPQNVGTVLDLICGKGDEEDLRVVFDKALEPEGLAPATRTKALSSLADAMQNRKLKPTGDLASVATLVKDARSPDVQAAAIRLAGVWQVTAAGDELQRLAGDSRASAELRQAALGSLVKLGGASSKSAIERLAGPDSRPADRYRAVAALAALDVDAAARLGAEALAAGDAAESPAPLVEAFLTVKHGPEKLAAALQNKRPGKDVAKLAIRAMYAFGHNDAALSIVLSEAAGVQADPPKPTAADIAKFVKEAGEKGDAARGEEVFRRADVGCLKCHAVARAGGAVGPDLSPLGATSPPEYVVTSILDPSAAIKEQYLTRNFETSDGFIVTGIVIDRNAERVRVRDANNREVVIPTAEIENEVEGKSLMPVGVTKFLTHEETLDLIRFVSELGKPGPFGPRSTPTIQRWRTPKAVPAELRGESADPEALRTFLQEDRPDAWTSAYAKVNGRLPLKDAAPSGEPADALLLQGELEITEPGPIRFRVHAPAGTTGWLDGSPLGSVPEFTPEPPLALGKHKLTLRVPRRAGQDDSLAVEIAPAEGSAAKFVVIGGP